MIRKVLKSNKNSLTLNLPDELVGRMIEIIAFSTDDEIVTKNPFDKRKKTSRL